ncbi:uncharacterized protein SPAPADRAFT_133905 [Spathaspora passalidarum NRRL Y-27907]|uniref:Uncharacterized protein n=1 Tax=Spathaspora passalidarum (strain NRRL Y-27907 / 11-Y1) TaxID=619300 RepID=G3AIE3_SPAPN|nr:uncharacterized protein SPAPADRAFT_133905 [Spathaspora passalidarum NRRL Y-27907]EGW34413.1 hypothetical protein SPAPADRAFT_133905 [Spathaspora passalidarum NRRL Y-27907]
MNRSNYKRKSTEAELEEEGDLTKRTRLDSLFDELSISDEGSSNSTRSYVINPGVKGVPYGGIAKKPANGQQTGSSIHNLDTFLSERLNEHLRVMISSQLAVIAWYDYRFLIVYQFHKWVVRMFNKFVKEYNQRNGTRVARFKNFESILKLVHDNVLTLPQVFDIVLQENRLELMRLRAKLDKFQLRRESREREEEVDATKEVKYNYWDNLKFDSNNDFEMADISDSSDRKLFELDPAYETDIDMASEGSSDSIKFNGSSYNPFYGNYSSRPV